MALAKKPQKKIVPLAKFDPDKLEEYMADAARSHADNEMLLKAVHDKIKEHGGVHGLLRSFTSTPGKEQEFAALLLNNYPCDPPDATGYQGREWKDGLTTCHLYHLGHDEEYDG